MMSDPQWKEMKLKHRKPCKECPFLKKSASGFFGGYTPEEYHQMAHGEMGVACHTAKHHEGTVACVGALQHANVAFKSYRNPCLRKLQDEVGKNPAVLDLHGFLEHHMGIKRRVR